MIRNNTVFAIFVTLSIVICEPVMAQPESDCSEIISLVSPDIPPQASDEFIFAEITPDGRFVLFRNIDFQFEIQEIVRHELLLYDRDTGVTESIELRTNIELPSEPYGSSHAMSGDARFISFASNSESLPNSNGRSQVYLLDRLTSTIEQISKSTAGVAANGSSDNPDVSNNGRYVAFSSTATNLVPEPTGGFNNIYLFDRTLNHMTLVSAGDNNSPPNDDSLPGMAPAPRQVIISADGRFVCYVSAADNLVGAAQPTSISNQLYLFDRLSGNNEIASLTNNGLPFFRNVADPAPSFQNQIFRPVQYDMSPDARYFAFDANFDNPDGPSAPGALTSLYVRDQTEQVTEQIDYAVPNIRDVTINPSISDDGAYIAFSTTLLGVHPLEFDEGTLVVNQYRYDRVNDRLQFIAENGSGESPNDRILGPWCSISADGHTVIFPSRASNLLSDGSPTEGIRAFVRTFQDDQAAVDWQRKCNFRSLRGKKRLGATCGSLS